MESYVLLTCTAICERNRGNIANSAIMKNTTNNNAAMLMSVLDTFDKCRPLSGFEMEEKDVTVYFSFTRAVIM